MINVLKISAAIAGLALVAGCGSNGDGSVVLNPASSTGKTTSYTQIERLSRPAIKEVFEPFQDHQKSNAVEPYQDTTIQNDIVGTENTLRPPNSAAGTNYGTTLASVLYPDEYHVNLAGTAPSGADPFNFLSYEVTQGAAFGGRAPNDDVIALELGVLFGHTLNAIGVVANDDKEENDCLSAQNITRDPSKSSTNTFPYLPSPH